MSSLTPLFTRRRFAAGSAAAAAFSALPAILSASQDRRPNILWIIAEDFCPDLGCYGNPLVRTPNLDRLAAQGMRFERAFTTAPVCSASRSAIMTGMYQTAIDAHNHRSHRDDGYRLPDGIHPFPHYFRRAGYHTSNLTNPAPGLRGSGKTDLNFNVENLFDGADWSERKPGQPFYAQVNFSETHRAFHRFEDHPVDPAKVRLPPYYPDHPAIREDFALYFDSAQHLDVKAGKVLDRIRQEGLEDETIVFFFGDHGLPMPRGKQFLYDDGIRVPFIARIPEKYRPQGFKPGSVSYDMVSAIDFTASSLALAGIEPPSHMHGRMIFGPKAQKRDHIVAARDRCDETVDRIRCVRTERYKYIRNFLPDRPYTQPNVYKDTSYPPLQVMRQLKQEGKLTGPPALFMADKRPAEELYDLQSDPHEIRNLANSALHGKILEELRGKLQTWIRTTGDKGETLEPSIPKSDAFRTLRVEGWSADNSCRLSRQPGMMVAACAGKPAVLRRAWVVPAGTQLELRFRARSASVALKSVAWTTVEHAGLGPASPNRSPVQFNRGSEWRDYSVPIRVPRGHLASLALETDGGIGDLQFQWIRLVETKSAASRTLAEWNFA